ncbi:MAG: hypothetical protein F4059_05680 [Gemmatimonadetes bacterium]|nr:hypothetical protein [Gemmatimonadota bacterium]
MVSAAHLHLVTVHLPVVLCPLALVLFLFARLRHDTPAARIARWLLVASAVVGVPAFFSGPPAFESMESELAAVRDLVELHAVLGRAAFFGLVLLALTALQTTLREMQEERVPGWLHGIVVVGTLLLSYVLAWTGHLGGAIRRPEIGEALSWLFPRW